MDFPRTVIRLAGTRIRGWFTIGMGPGTSKEQGMAIADKKSLFVGGGNGAPISPTGNAVTDLERAQDVARRDRKSTRLNSSH